MQYVLVLVAIIAGACGKPSDVHGVNDAGISDDASQDAPPVDKPYSISIGAPSVIADPVQPRTVTVTGAAGASVVIGLDNPVAGTVSPTTVTIDSNGNATTTFTPCLDIVPNCLGAATLTLAVASMPTTSVAQLPIMLTPSPNVGDITPCLTGGDVFFYDDVTDNVTLTSSSTDVWTMAATPDQIEFSFQDGGSDAGFYDETFSLVELTQPLAPGTFEDAERAGFETSGHPGMDVIAANAGCNAVAGRFEIYDYTADPVNGAVYSATIGFEASCDASVVFTGCVHYETPPPVVMTCPTLDPTNASVQVLTSTGSPDASATAIFTDAMGTVVVDTQVDACGQAQAPLPDGGVVTTINTVSGIEEIHTYRGVKSGDHVVIDPPSSTSGSQDMMLASFTPPTGTTTAAFMTACGGGSWAKGNGPIDADLTFYDGCRTPTFDMLTIASIPGGPNQFVWQTGLAHSPNGNVSVASDWAPMGTATVTLANVPANTASLNTTWSNLIGATSVQMSGLRVDVPVAGDQNISLSYPPNAGDGAVASVTVFTNAVSSESRAAVQLGQPSSLTIDFASQPVPMPSLVHQTANSATWTLTSGGTADVRSVQWLARLGSGTPVAWTIVEPDDGLASSAMPSLPAAQAAEDPTVDPNAVLDGASVAYTDYDVLSGFSLAPPSAPYNVHSAGAQTFMFHF